MNFTLEDGNADPFLQVQVRRAVIRTLRMLSINIWERKYRISQLSGGPDGCEKHPPRKNPVKLFSFFPLFYFIPKRNKKVFAHVSTDVSKSNNSQRGRHLCRVFRLVIDRCRHMNGNAFIYVQKQLRWRSALSVWPVTSRVCLVRCHPKGKIDLYFNLVIWKRIYR